MKLNVFTRKGWEGGTDLNFHRARQFFEVLSAAFEKL